MPELGYGAVRGFLDACCKEIVKPYYQLGDEAITMAAKSPVTKVKSRKRGDVSSVVKTSIGDFDISQARGDELARYLATLPREPVMRNSQTKAVELQRMSGSHSSMKRVKKVGEEKDGGEKAYILLTSHEPVGEKILLTEGLMQQYIFSRLFGRETAVYMRKRESEKYKREYVLTEYLGSTWYDEHSCVWKVRTLLKEMLLMHILGFVHGDVKLENITVDEDDNLHLIDFCDAQSISNTSECFSPKTRLVGNLLSMLDSYYVASENNKPYLFHFGMDYWGLVVALADKLPNCIAKVAWRAVESEKRPELSGYHVCSVEFVSGYESNERVCREYKSYIDVLKILVAGGDCANNLAENAVDVFAELLDYMWSDFNLEQCQQGAYRYLQQKRYYGMSRKWVDVLAKVVSMFTDKTALQHFFCTLREQEDMTKYDGGPDIIALNELLDVYRSSLGAEQKDLIKNLATQWHVKASQRHRSDLWSSSGASVNTSEPATPSGAARACGFSSDGE